MDTAPIAQTAIEADFVAVNERLEHVTQEMAKRARAAADAEHAYKVAYAKALLVAKDEDPKRSVGVCEAIATLECDRLLHARLHCDAVLDAAKEAGRNARAEGENLRSINANHRALVVGS